MPGRGAIDAERVAVLSVPQGGHGLSLTAPALLAEVTVSIRPDGTHQTLVSKVPNEREMHQAIVTAVIQAAYELAQAYGLKIQAGSHPLV